MDYSIQFFLLFTLFILGISALPLDIEDEALRECSNLHHIEVQHFPSAKGFYENGKCTLKCYIEGRELTSDAINEDFPCPGDPSGVSDSS